MNIETLRWKNNTLEMPPFEPCEGAALRGRKT